MTPQEFITYLEELHGEANENFEREFYANTDEPNKALIGRYIGEGLAYSIVLHKLSKDPITNSFSHPERPTMYIVLHPYSNTNPTAKFRVALSEAWIAFTEGYATSYPFDEFSSFAEARDAATARNEAEKETPPTYPTEDQITHIAHKGKRVQYKDRFGTVATNRVEYNVPENYGMAHVRVDFDDNHGKFVPAELVLVTDLADLADRNEN